VLPQRLSISLYPVRSDALFAKPNNRLTPFPYSALGNNRFPHGILAGVNGYARQPTVIAVLGPTASGKSVLGIELALRLNGEIINCDSVQVYQGINVATAKVPPAERRGVPHHLIDFVPPEVNFSAGEWAREAANKIREIHMRGRLPIIVGGTGFYFRALRQPFFPSPQTDLNIRHRLNQIRQLRGPEHLHRILTRLDAVSAQQLFPRDWPRVQRAIEVSMQTGKPISAQKHLGLVASSIGQIRVIALNPPRSALYHRINARTQEHFSAGLVEEVRQLLALGVAPDSNALGAHGYRRVVEYLQSKRDLAAAIEQTKLDVRHYAKRQLTWLRREADVEWYAGFGDDANIQRRVFKALNTEVSQKQHKLSSPSPRISG